MSPSDFFLSNTKTLLDAIQSDEKASISAAAALIRDQIAANRLVHVFGVSGHSVIGGEEFFWRAGGLACVSPVFDLSLMLSGGGEKSTMLERVPGVGDKVVRSLHLGPQDLLVIASIYGMNAATIDAALEAKKAGAKIIAITSRHHASSTPANFVARHPSGQNLHDLADVTIDNHVPHGDTIVGIPGQPQKVGAVSTMLVSFCVQSLVIETVRQCAEAGLEAPVWQSANTVGGDAANERHFRNYAHRIKAL